MDYTIVDDQGRLRPDVLDDPYSLYAELRLHEPVHYDEGLRGWMLTRYRDVQEAMVDDRLSASRTQAYLSELPAVDRDRFRRFADTRADMLLFCDPPKHTRLRRAVREALGTASTDVTDFVESTVADIVNGLDSNASLDLIAEIALPLPIAVLLRLLGVPPNDEARLRAWATSFNLAIGGVIRPELVDEAERALDELSTYLEALLGQRHVGSTVLTTLRNGRMTEAELLASCLMLVTAGHESATNMIGNGLYALCRHPREVAWLREDLSRLPAAIDELLRYDAPVQLTAREAREPIDIRGVRIPAGDRVIPLWGAANRDPEVFDDPARLRLGRANSRRHLSFGSGRHRCAGSSLARIEAQAVMKALLERFECLTLIGEPTWKPNFSFRGLHRLVVSVGQA